MGGAEVVGAVVAVVVAVVAGGATVEDVTGTERGLGGWPSTP